MAVDSYARSRSASSVADPLSYPPRRRTSTSSRHRLNSSFDSAVSEFTSSSTPPPRANTKGSGRARSKSSSTQDTLSTAFQSRPRSHTHTSATYPRLPQVYPLQPPTYFSHYTPSTATTSPSSASMKSDSDEDDHRGDDDHDGIIWHAPGGQGGVTHRGTLRARLFGGFIGGHAYGKGSKEREGLKMISTTPGLLGAGETETEADEPPARLPTSRILPSSAPLIPPNTLQERLTPLLFEFSRLLAVVPALIGTLYNVYFVIYGTDEYVPGRPEKVDYVVAALWSILTGFQCLALTTGLLTRWRIYYTPLSTLVRLLALQSICWPATHWTLKIFDGGMFDGAAKRPVIVWAIIGTTTSFSRSIQIWVTSNLWWEQELAPNESVSSSASQHHPHHHHHHHNHSHNHNRPRGSVTSLLRSSYSNTSVSGIVGGGGGGGNGVGTPSGRSSGRGGYWKRWRGGKWGGRRWDWKEVGVKCVLPACLVYMFMAWAEALRREWRGC